MLMPYTSASSALNQNVGLNVSESAPMAAAPYIASLSINATGFSFHKRKSFTIERYKNAAVNALAKGEMRWTRTAGSCAVGSIENTFARIKNSGDPGGCGTCIRYVAAMNSPTSQKTTVSERVLM